VPINDRWEFLANWTNNDAETATGARRLRRPENLGNLGLLYRADEGLSFIANYRISRDAIDVGNVALPDYEVLDFSLNWDVSDRFQVYGRVQNVTDETYVEVATYNTAERSLYGGIRLSF
jgi:vitamin B12 transporter